LAFANGTRNHGEFRDGVELSIDGAQRNPAGEGGDFERRDASVRTFSSTTVRHLLAAAGKKKQRKLQQSQR
jgi:hypothetical protein